MAAVKAVTNCMMSKEVVREMAEENRETSPSFIDSLHTFLHTHHDLLEEDPLLNQLSLASKDLKHFLTHLQTECTLALLMINQVSTGVTTNAGDESKVHFLMQCLKRGDVHIICKALTVLADMA